MTNMAAIVPAIHVRTIFQQQHDDLTKIKKDEEFEKLLYRHELEMKGQFARTSLWAFAAAKWSGELRPPKVEYLARHGLSSSSIRASTRSPSLAAETNRSPDAEHPSEFPIAIAAVDRPPRPARPHRIPHTDSPNDFNLSFPRSVPFAAHLRQWGKGKGRRIDLPPTKTRYLYIFTHTMERAEGGDPARALASNSFFFFFLVLFLSFDLFCRLVTSFLLPRPSFSSKTTKKTENFFVLYPISHPSLPILLPLCGKRALAVSLFFTRARARLLAWERI
ncbi:hypothetical protein HPP92_014014 [Vanilla planifolia]|uniref:Uncharacterized protein n=1 Tax=Vanilla planifolia TaxID=51239 RepID=A0A835QMK0_VANPL|nr:hypothetical protein HPP92_014014 [Vanilla planifolia]